MRLSIQALKHKFNCIKPAKSYITRICFFLAAYEGISQTSCLNIPYYRGRLNILDALDLWPQCSGSATPHSAPHTHTHTHTVSVSKLLDNYKLVRSSSVKMVKSRVYKEVYRINKKFTSSKETARSRRCVYMKLRIDELAE